MKKTRKILFPSYSKPNLGHKKDAITLFHQNQRKVLFVIIPERISLIVFEGGMHSFMEFDGKFFQTTALNKKLLRLRFITFSITALFLTFLKVFSILCTKTWSLVPSSHPNRDVNNSRGSTQSNQIKGVIGGRPPLITLTLSPIKLGRGNILDAESAILGNFEKYFGNLCLMNILLS